MCLCLSPCTMMSNPWWCIQRLCMRWWKFSEKQLFEHAEVTSAETSNLMSVNCRQQLYVYQAGSSVMPQDTTCFMVITAILSKTSHILFLLLNDKLKIVKISPASPVFSFTRWHLSGAIGPSVGGLEEEHRGAGGGPLLLHHVQGPPQEPGPHRQLRGGGQAVGQKPGENDVQQKQPQPPAEDRTVSSSW